MNSTRLLPSCSTAAAVGAFVALLTCTGLHAPLKAAGDPEVAAENQQRASWDQQRAVEIVRGVLETEAGGQPWDEIKWRTDPDEAVAEARLEDKPLLVYFYLRKPVGPDDAPC